MRMRSPRASAVLGGLYAVLAAAWLQDMAAAVDCPDISWAKTSRGTCVRLFRPGASGCGRSFLACNDYCRDLKLPIPEEWRAAGGAPGGGNYSGDGLTGGALPCITNDADAALLYTTASQSWSNVDYSSSAPPAHGYSAGLGTQGDDFLGDPAWTGVFQDNAAFERHRQARENSASGRGWGNHAQAACPTTYLPQDQWMDDYQGTSEDCLMVNYDAKKTWHDAPCNSQYNCVCEWPASSVLRRSFSSSAGANYSGDSHDSTSCHDDDDLSGWGGAALSGGLQFGVWLFIMGIIAPIICCCRNKSMNKAPFNGQPVAPVATVAGMAPGSTVMPVQATAYSAVANPVVQPAFTTVEVTCPAGSKPGSLIQVEHAGQTLQLEVPPGVEPGMPFQVQVPAAQPVIMAAVAVAMPTPPGAVPTPMSAAAGGLGTAHMAAPVGQNLNSVQDFVQNTAMASDPGLLGQSQGVYIRQKFDLVEACGIEAKNKYDVRINDESGMQTMFIREESAACERICCGPNRHLVLYVHQGHDKLGTVIGQIHRSFGLPNCCCIRPKLVVTDGQGVEIGRIDDPFKCCDMDQIVYDKDGNKVYGVAGSICQIGMCCPCCGEVKFDVTNPADQEVGSINKIFGGCAEVMTGCNQFQCVFPTDANPQQKMVLLGATMGLDMSYFEKSKNNNH